VKKTLILTGCSKGIGYATARLFQDNDWQIINISRSNSNIENIINVKIDLADIHFESILNDNLKGILKGKQQICLVHNAAYHIHDKITDQNPDELTKTLNVSIVSPSILNRYLIPFMAEGSSIIYIGSTLSEKAVPGVASYVIAKHAAIGMMRATCQDLAKLHIHTCCVCPGFTNTEMLQGHLNNDPALIEFAKNKVGAERLIEPAEIANTIYFVAQNPVINGSVIHANLGQLET
jgi:3-oxoacyl-[acyl-carrier protein] reductase